MAGSFTIDVTSLVKGGEKIKSLEGLLSQKVNDVLDANAIAIETKAKLLAPVDMGGLHNSIASNLSKALEKHITVNTFYAAFVEFGTGSYAAQYVGSLPGDWQQFARQFKGQKGGGTAYDLWLRLIEWVKRNSRLDEGAVTGTHGKSGRRTGNKSRQQAENEAAAYAIMIKILKRGIKPQPFLFPAYEDQRKTIVNDVENALKSL